MSIAAANLVARNIHGRYFRSDATNDEGSRVAKITSLFIKAGALAFVLYLPMKYAINLQLLGGIWILQTLPAVAFGLYRCWFHERALLIGWFAGMIAGTAMFVSQEFAPVFSVACRRHDVRVLHGIARADRQSRFRDVLHLAP